jgi:hypothetical protein
MQKQNLAASGRIIIDEFHERFFLFVHSSTHLTVGGETVAARLLEGIGLDGRAAPAGFSSNPSALSGFRIVRLLDEQIMPKDIRSGLVGPGDRSRAVTISGHIATEKERGGPRSVDGPHNNLQQTGDLRGHSTTCLRHLPLRRRRFRN